MSNSATSSSPKRIAIGSDHAGYELKAHLVQWLEALGYRVEDYGTHSTEAVDYPHICADVARAVRDAKADVGIVMGGSGQGEQIAANKVRGIRAALCNDLWLAEMARSHNDANVLSMGGRVVTNDMAEQIVKKFLETPFEAGRHARRVGQLSEIEVEEATHRES
ncbi:MAG: ribose-5-phosphate isomerase [Actinomycetota bacterium]|jgi:ribose 5-phosphate isomerase B